MRPEDFNVGDRVIHIGNGEVGTVASVDKFVDVEFDRKREDGSAWSGKYDANWFRIIDLLRKHGK